MPRPLTLLFAVATAAPVLIWIFAVAATLLLAGPMGCSIDEGSVHPCLIAGQDWGEAAYTLGMIAAWGLFFLAPLSFGAGLLWGLTVLLFRLFKRRV